MGISLGLSFVRKGNHPLTRRMGCFDTSGGLASMPVLDATKAAPVYSAIPKPLSF